MPKEILINNEELKKDYKVALENALKTIDWYLVHHGCEHYYIYNNHKQATDLLFFGNRIELENTNVFGRPKKDYSKNGVIVFNLNDCVIYIHDKPPDTITISSKDNDGIFIQLYKKE